MSLWRKVTLIATALAVATWSWSGAAAQQQAEVVAGALCNPDVRIPHPGPSGQMPTDVEIKVYGIGITPDWIKDTWDSNTQYQTPLNWGPPDIDQGPARADGLDCVVVRWAGAAIPVGDAGKITHLGVRIRSWCIVRDWEVTWTYPTGPPRPWCDIAITWICTRNGWTICLTNPTPEPVYLYGCGWFPLPQPVPGQPLPFPELAELTADLQPPAGAVWTHIPPPNQGVDICILPKCRIYLHVVVQNSIPIVFRTAVRNVANDVVPIPNDPTVPQMAADFVPPRTEGEQGQGTMVVHFDRPVFQNQSDLNCDGVVFTPDFNIFRGDFGFVGEQ